MAERMMEPMESREDQQATTCADALQGFWSATEFLLRPGGLFETQEELVFGEPMQVFRNRKRHFLELLETSALYGRESFWYLKVVHVSRLPNSVFESCPQRRRCTVSSRSAREKGSRFVRKMALAGLLLLQRR